MKHHRKGGLAKARKFGIGRFARVRDAKTGRYVAGKPLDVIRPEFLKPPQVFDGTLMWMPMNLKVGETMTLPDGTKIGRFL